MPEPLLPLAIFRRRALVGASVTALALTGTTGAAAVLATSHLQQVLDRSPTATGLVFLPFSLAVIAGSAVAPVLLTRLGTARTAASGLVGVAAAMLLFTRISITGGVPYLVGGLALAGATLGWASVAATRAGTAQAGAGEQGLVAGLLNTATQLGTSIGIAVLSTIAAAGTDAAGGDLQPASPPALVEGFQTAFVAAAALALSGAVAAAALLRRGNTTDRPSHLQSHSRSRCPEGSVSPRP